MGLGLGPITRRAGRGRRSANAPLLAGVVFGPHGLHVGPKSHEVAHFFADIGKLLLMFFAGLEIDLVQFRRTGRRSLVFGLATFAMPLAGGFLVGLDFGYGWQAAPLHIPLPGPD
jgi:Kef-type K+ transport system membrane component KefB